MNLGERVSYQLQSWRSVCVGASLIWFSCAPLFWREDRIWYEHELCFPTVCAGSFHFGRRQGWRWDSLVTQRVKSLPAMWEMWVRSLGQEDSLEKKMTTHSSILAWKIPWMEEPGGLQSIGSQTVKHNWVTSLSLLGLEMVRRWPDPGGCQGLSSAQQPAAPCWGWR